MERDIKRNWTMNIILAHIHSHSHVKELEKKIIIEKKKGGWTNKQKQIIINKKNRVQKLERIKVNAGRRKKRYIEHWH